MALGITLATNEVKDRTGTEIEFNRLGSEGRSCLYAAVLEAPAYKHRLSIRHAETGVGMKLRRRSVIRFDKTTLSGIDTITPITTSFYGVLDHPVGASANNNEAANVIAEFLSFVATTGAANTVLFDCTGTGAQVFLTGAI